MGLCIMFPKSYFGIQYLVSEELCGLAELMLSHKKFGFGLQNIGKIRFELSKVLLHQALQFFQVFLGLF